MTGRLPFDPKKMKGAKTDQRVGDGGDTPPSSVLRDSGKPNPMTVSQLASGIDRAIRSGLPSTVLVEGEISSLSHRTHYYFSLKDEHAVVGAVFFASAAARSNTKPEHGQRVIAKGRVEFYAPSGRVSLIVTSLRPVGEGVLEQRYKQLVEQLRARGWFDPESKRPLPSFPRKVAIVTSKDGAAVQDVIDTFARRCPSIELLVVDARVQGEQAKGQVSRAIRSLNANREQLGLDAIIVTRGGGSLEDLWAFNEPEVAQAIHDSTLPIVAAIGHETDTTIAELVADERAATPTQAAMRLSPDRAALIEQLTSLHNRLRRAVAHRVRYEQQRLHQIQSSRSMRDPREVIAVHRQRMRAIHDRAFSGLRHHIARERSSLDRLAIRLTRVQPAAVHARRQERIDQLAARLERVMKRAIAQRREDLEHTARQLHAIGPAQVLSRGFTLTLGPDGKALRSVEQASPGTQIETVLRDGRIQSRVESDSGDNDPRLRAPKPVPRRTKRSGNRDDDQSPSLFE
ncbi:MAG: exodeoxyribonuclease VII large subunit [Phycisphaerae bacterium]|nr:exodeoxyribonuclease VII large subunit [Phycisphaerae bacterium]MBM91490.1 exodeoxyribonuclease VII large subunit [Phycisphaerae bacterium]MBM92640.1 exodeoxyribonuclease VII large subunit [Phycisphaerae bacterium]